MALGAGHELFAGAILETVDSGAAITPRGDAGKNGDNQKAHNCDAGYTHKNIIHSKINPDLIKYATILAQIVIFVKIKRLIGLNRNPRRGR